MFEISDDPDLLTKYLDFDVYYRSQGHFGLYKKKGTTFDPIRVKFGKLPEKLYISRADRIYLVKEKTRELNEKLKRELKKDPSRAKNRITEVVALSLSEPRVEVLEDMKDTIDIVVEEYLASPQVLKNLVQVSVKDYTTQLHLTNVMLFCLGYAYYAGFNEKDMRLLGLAGLLHDVGKVDVPDEILIAPRQLTDEEFQLIKQHPKKGWKMLKSCKFDDIIPICALEHHERLDGSGYPDGKIAKDLCESSRALALVDIYEALTNWRPYKEPMLPVSALKIMKSEVEGNRLDPSIFKEFAKSIIGLTR
ncbi:MAG: HD domain-containing protein [Deltaproteobacteria bacterium]|nr:HD domain-containing protein [Deltaproteobacteria bacterium]MBW2150876.1 HD domain-containing protein [Deltaproteobacteria bacterium]